MVVLRTTSWSTTVPLAPWSPFSDTWSTSKKSRKMSGTTERFNDHSLCWWTTWLTPTVRSASALRTSSSWSSRTKRRPRSPSLGKLCVPICVICWMRLMKTPTPPSSSVSPSSTASSKKSPMSWFPSSLSPYYKYINLIISIPLGSSTSLSPSGSVLSSSHYSSSLDHSCLWSFFLTETSWCPLAVFSEYWGDRANRSVRFSRTSYEIDIFLVWFAVVSTFILMRTTPLLLFPVTIPLKMMCRWFWAITCATHVTSIKQFNWIFRTSISSSLTMYVL